MKRLLGAVLLALTACEPSREITGPQDIAVLDNLHRTLFTWRPAPNRSARTEDSPAHWPPQSGIATPIYKDADSGALPDIALTASYPPLSRALAQRELWMWFDAPGSTGISNYHIGLPASREFSARIARIIANLALSAREIRALPDPYEILAKSGKWSARYDPRRPDQPFLPDDLWKPDGPWVILSESDGSPIARAHLQFFRGRSVFTVLLRHPEGRTAGVRLVSALRNGSPDLPEGTVVALVRRAIFINTNRTMTPSSLTESIQLRVATSEGERVSMFRLKPEGAVSARTARLIPVARQETEYPYILFMGRNAGVVPERILTSCRSCHAPRPSNLNVVNRRFTGGSNPRSRLLAGSRETEETRTLEWKRSERSWKLLCELLAPK